MLLSNVNKLYGTKNTVVDFVASRFFVKKYKNVHKGLCDFQQACR